jgi:hypothetical protein
MCLRNVGKLLPDYTASHAKDGTLHSHCRENLKSYVLHDPIYFIFIYMAAILNVHYDTGKQFRNTFTRKCLLLNQSTATRYIQRKIYFTLRITGTYSTYICSTSYTTTSCSFPEQSLLPWHTTNCFCKHTCLEREDKQTEIKRASDQDRSGWPLN